MKRSEKIGIFRERFYGRQDMYGKQWVYTRADGSTAKGFAPRCSMFWTEGCHIRNKTGTTCPRCEIKQYDPVNDEGTWFHIDGEEASLVYLVQDNGTIRFCAFDFDMKEKKEAQGYTFEDVKIVSKLLADENIPHGIARSTTAGFHLYIFFEDFYSAHKFRTIAYWLVERAGFMEQMRQGIRPLCEIFPRQSYTGGFGPGNGIKPPMIEPMWEKERNCFVDADNVFIPKEQQWDYLNSIPYATTAALDAIIERHGIEVDEEQPQMNIADATRRALSRNFASNRGKWQQPLTGSFEKVVEGCSALRRVFEKAAKGSVPGHQEGMSSFHIAMQCVDGIEVFKTKMTGWGKTDKDWQQLQHSIDKSYAPWTCRKMQENGVCVAGTKCFERRPPIVLVEGHYVLQTDIPPEEWPEPGPIRYAYGKGEDFLEKLKKEVDDIQGEQDENVKGNKLRDIAKRAQVFDEDQQRALREHIKNKKVIKANDLSKMFNKAGGEYSKEFKEKASTRSDTVNIGKNTYQLMSNPRGYAMMKLNKDGPSWDRISNCFLEIEEERAYLDDDTIVKSVYKGRLVSDKINSPFEISQDEWWDNNKFLTYFGKLGGTSFNVLKEDLNYIRQAALAFSERRGISQHSHLMTQGWYGSTYFMPGIKIDKHGVHTEPDESVDLSTKYHAQHLAFKEVTEEKQKEILTHIITEFLNTWPRKWTMIGLAHAILPALAALLKIARKPTLFLEGQSSSGKTELLHGLQCLYGDFPALLNLNSSAKGIEAIAFDFKDVLLAIDDYKGINAAQANTVKNVIQYCYDGSGRVILNCDSSIRIPKKCRAGLGLSGEHFVANEASVLGRTLIIQTGIQDHANTKHLYDKHVQMRPNYCAVIPKLIHFLLNSQVNDYINHLKTYETGLLNKHSGKSNAARIASNAATNHIVWCIFIDFILSYSCISSDEAITLKAEHDAYMHELFDVAVEMCAEEGIEQVFVDRLRELISSRELVVTNLNCSEFPQTKTRIGFVNFIDKKTVYLYPGQTFREVMRRLGEAETRTSVRAIGSFLATEGILLKCDKGRFQQTIRDENGATVKVWKIDGEKFGLCRESPLTPTYHSNREIWGHNDNPFEEGEI